MKESSLLSKEDCKSPMTEEDGRQVQISMLDALVQLCNYDTYLSQLYGELHEGAAG